MPGSRTATAPAPVVPTDRPITRDDIEKKFRSLGSDVDNVAETAKGTAVVIGTIVVVGVVLGAFLLGKRRGKRKTAFIEIRRV
jgi:hypothetical protein